MEYADLQTPFNNWQIGAVAPLFVTYIFLIYAEKINISRKTMATHLTEIRHPLSGGDPQFGKSCPKEFEPATENVRESHTLKSKVDSVHYLLVLGVEVIASLKT